MEDYLEECLREARQNLDEHQGDGEELTVEHFQEVFCQTCMNSSCRRSQASESSWVERMGRQASNLYDPDFAEPDDFPDRHRQAFESYHQKGPEDQTGYWMSFGGDNEEEGEQVESPSHYQSEPASAGEDDDTDKNSANDPSSSDQPTGSESASESEKGASNSKARDASSNESDPQSPSRSVPNTPAPEGGVMVGTDGEGETGGTPSPSRSSSSRSSPSSSSWEVDEGDSGITFDFDEEGDERDGSDQEG